jgi:hypothetical protein
MVHVWPHLAAATADVLEVLTALPGTERLVKMLGSLKLTAAP